MTRSYLDLRVINLKLAQARRVWTEHQADQPWGYSRIKAGRGHVGDVEQPATLALYGQATMTATMSEEGDQPHFRIE
jgi:hypothetical protein